jgi:hypothetical protein
MLGEAIQHLKALPRDAKQRADAFEAFAAQIEQESGGAWQAARSTGTDGCDIFLGRLGESLIVAPGGSIYRGAIGSGLELTPAGIRPDYNVLKALA